MLLALNVLEPVDNGRSSIPTSITKELSLTRRNRYSPVKFVHHSLLLLVLPPLHQRFKPEYQRFKPELRQDYQTSAAVRLRLLLLRTLSPSMHLYIVQSILTQSMVCLRESHNQISI